MKAKGKVIKKALGGFGGIVAVIALIFAILQFWQGVTGSEATDSANATIVAVLKESKEIASERATLEASEMKTGPTATAATQKLIQLEGTVQALGEAKRMAEATRLALKNLSPSLTNTPPPTRTPVDTPTSTPRPTHTPVGTPTSNPVPSPTNTIQPTQTPTKTPKPTPRKVGLYKISLQSKANESTFNGYATPPLGDIELGGVQFNLPRGQNSITTQAETLSDFPIRINLATEIFSPEEVYLLITGGNTFSQFSGKKMGVIRLMFRDNEPLSVDLVAGYNIREWKLLDEHTVSKTTSEQVKEVWRTESNFGGVGVIDMLTIGLPTRYQTDYLEAIEIIDTSTETVGSKDPAINLIAVTVKGS